MRLRTNYLFPESHHLSEGRDYDVLWPRPLPPKFRDLALNFTTLTLSLSLFRKISSIFLSHFRHPTYSPPKKQTSMEKQNQLLAFWGGLLGVSNGDSLAIVLRSKEDLQKTLRPPQIVVTVLCSHTKWRPSWLGSEWGLNGVEGGGGVGRGLGGSGWRLKVGGGEGQKRCGKFWTKNRDEPKFCPKNLRIFPTVI